MPLREEVIADICDMMWSWMRFSIRATLSRGSEGVVGIDDEKNHILTELVISPPPISRGPMHCVEGDGCKKKFSVGNSNRR